MMVSSVLAADPATKPSRAAIRVNAGMEEDWKDGNGNVWKADFGSEGGSTMDRDGQDVANAKGLERMYQTERYSMDSYSFKVENGKWMVKLHFSEGYDGIQDETGRVFGYEVKDGAADKGKSVKKVEHFSPWKASGGFGKAYADSIPVDVTNGQISIVFTPENENVQINGIEILPQDREAIRVNCGLSEDWKDASGNVWKADFGGEGGGEMDRDSLEVAGAKGLERVYQTERYGMDSYGFKVANGKWLVKLHFSEGYDGNADENSRIFAFDVKDGDAAKGKVVKGEKKFSPWKAAGGFGKVYVWSTPVEVTNGQISIVFHDVEADNSQINGIEIIPQ
jgi:hypothetical protein